MLMRADLSLYRQLVLRGLLMLSLLLAALPGRAATPQVVVGDNSTGCLLKQDGTVSCWGYSDGGIADPPPGPFVQISMGTGSGCGLRDNGQVECWGRDEMGLLDVPPGTYSKVDAGWNYHCAIRDDDHRIVCWGTLVGGEYIPFQGPEDHFTDVDAGYVSFCGVRENGTLACTWFNSGPEPPAGTFTKVDSNDFTICAIKTSGEPLCWGTTTYKHDQVAPGQFTTIDVGAYHACGLKTDGTIGCWGYYGNQDYGQYYPPSGKFTSLGVGFVSNCALREDGVTICWGIDTVGEAPRFRIAPKPLLAAEVGIHFNAQLAMQDVGTIWTVSPYVPVNPIYSLAAGDLPAGVTLSAAGQLEGTAAATGIWPITIRARDDNGFEALRATEFTVVNPGDDVTPPVITSHVDGLNQAGTWYKTDILVTWNVDDPESTATLFGCDPELIDADTPREGVILDCAARSTGGASREYLPLRRDATPPTVQVLAVTPLADPGWFTVTFNATDVTSDLNYVECALDDVATFGFCYNWSEHRVGPLSQGTHTLFIRATDNASNTSDPIPVEIDVGGGDTTPPVVTPNVTGTPGLNGWYLSDVAVSWSVVEGESLISASTGCDPSSVMDDTTGVTFTCSATSAGGNTTQSITIKRDTVNPDTAITASPSNPANPGVANFQFNGSDGTAGVAMLACSLDNAPFTACTSPLQTIALGAGPHTFAVQATDAAGNVDGTPATYAWTVVNLTDFSPPVANPTFNKTPTIHGWFNTNVTVLWNWTDSGTGIDPLRCTLQTAVTTEGFRQVSAQCRDLAGNIGTATVNVAIDKTPPTVSASLADSELLIRDTSAVAFASATDALSGIATRSCDPLQTASVGSKTATCRATDRAGNIGTGTGTYWVVYGVEKFNPPTANPPTVNVVARNFAFAIRWRLIDANGQPVTTVKVNEVGRNAFEVPASNCTGTTQQVTLGSDKKLANLGNGNYELGTYFPKNWAPGCYFFWLGDLIETKFVIYKVL